MQRVALITGSTEGIGFASARKLALGGAHVVICSRRQKNVDRAVKELQQENLPATGLVCHVAKPEDRKRLLDMIQQKFGGLDILVLNAAVNPHVGDILSTKESVFDKIFDVNLKSTFMFIKEAFPLMQERKNASIVLVSSLSAFVPFRSVGFYAVTKTALVALTKALMNELKENNIRVNCIAPGVIRTTFAKNILSDGDEPVTNSINVKRVGTPEDCAGVVDFLCSESASYITGETVVVAGGVTGRL